jgi:hypothetical protein
MSVNPHIQRGRRLPRRPRQFDPNNTVAIFENPTTGWREGVSHHAWLWVLLFGGFYLAARGVWRPVIFMLAVSLVAGFVFWPLLVIVMPGFWIIAAT